MSKEKLIRDLELKLSNVPGVPPHVMDVIILELQNYDVTERAHEVIPYDDRNARILKTYCACLDIDGKSQRTIAAYRALIQRVANTVGKQYTEMTPYDLRMYLAIQKQRGASNRTLENYRAFMSAFFQWLAAEGYAGSNPAARIKPIKCAEEIRLPFSTTDLDRLRTACQTPAERAMIEVLLSTGARASEFCGLTLSDVDMRTKTVKIKYGKGGKSRTVYMTDLAMMHLRHYLATRNDEEQALFVSRRGKPYTTGGIEFKLHGVAKRAGVDDVHPHRFRRTLATRLAQRGMAVQDIQQILGHSDIQTTMVYVHVSEEQTRIDYQRYTA